MTILFMIPSGSIHHAKTVVPQVKITLVPIKYQNGSEPM